MQEQPAEIFRNFVKPKTARFDEKLSQLLTATARLFAEQGYEKASMRQVAQAANISLPGLYYYVRGKEELLFLIQHQTFGALADRLAAILAQPHSPEHHLEEMVFSHVRYLVAHLPELKVCTTELDSLGGEYYQQVLSRRQQYFELTRQILARLQRQDQGSRVEPNLAALYLFGMLNWIVMWFDPERNNPTTLATSLVTFFLGGFRPTPGATESNPSSLNRVHLAGLAEGDP